jgi:hypothetical protein
MQDQKSQQLALIPPETVAIQVTNLNSIFQEIQKVQQQIVSLRDKAHVLTPMARTNLDPQLIAYAGRIPVLRIASISTKKTDDGKEYVEGEVYDVKETGKLALTKIGLQRLDALAGLTNWKIQSGLVPAGMDPQTRTTRYDPLHAKTTARAEIEDIDGTIRNSEQTYELDLNDGTPQAKKLKDLELVRSRQNIVALAECVPIRAEILTKHGWKRYSSLSLGESVLAYDCGSDRCLWTPLENISVFERVDTVRLERRGFSTICTPNHSWVVRSRFGVRNKNSRIALVKASDLLGASRALKRIVTAAPGPTGDHPLSPVDAAILGWIVTEGCVRETMTHSVHNGMRYGPYEPFMRAHITQVEGPNADAIRSLLPLGSYSESVSGANLRTFPTGKTYATHRGVQFCLHAAYWRSLFARAGIEGKADLPRLATALSAPARKAMLEAMLMGDGTRHGNCWVFTQKRGPVLDAFQILAALEGYGLGPERERVVVEQTLWRRPNIAIGGLEISPLGSPEPVWCPTTLYETWVMRLDGQICITGNTKAMNRVRRTLLGIQSGFRLQDLAKPFVILKTIPAPLNMNDPFIRKLVIMKQTGVTSEMYDQALGIAPSYSAPAQIPEVVPRPLVIEPPMDATGVSVPEPPPFDDDDDDLPPSAPDTREAMIVRIEALYLKKLGKSRFEHSPNKLPLVALRDEELEAIEKRLNEYPDHNPV